ncbi:MAG: zinc ABC transporter substrate-binding protein, partial [Jiangellaceae bacterium]|nr:zinc ABC transporter substrate-binding protein [Jiangellaceae bacterium]
MFVMPAGGGLAVAAAVGVLAGGCAQSGTGAEDGRPSVAASSYPLAFVAERVGSPSVDVVDLSASSTDSHDLELTPHQVGAIAQADLVVYQSDYQPAVAEAVEQHANGARIDVAAESDTADPHVWLDPTLLGRIAESVAAALTEVAPDKTADIERRADGLVAELRALDDEFRAGLARCQRRTVVVSHDAFGHLADRYGLHFTGIAGTEPDAEPSPARLG